MLTRIFIFAVCAVLAGNGCSIIGGGIAGAGWDSAWARRAAENYEGYCSPRVEIKTEAMADGSAGSQDFDVLLSKFPQHGTVEPGQSARLAGLGVSLRPAHIRIVFPGGVTMDEPLPSVFRDRPFQFALCTLGGEPVLIVLNRARASTGLCFLGLYTRDGKRLLTRVFPRRTFWQVRTSPNALHLESNNQRTNICLSDR